MEFLANDSNKLFKYINETYFFQKRKSRKVVGKHYHSSANSPLRAMIRSEEFAAKRELIRQSFRVDQNVDLQEDYQLAIMVFCRNYLIHNLWRARFV